MRRFTRLTNCLSKRVENLISYRVQTGSLIPAAIADVTACASPAGLAAQQARVSPQQADGTDDCHCEANVSNHLIGAKCRIADCPRT